MKWPNENRTANQGVIHVRSVVNDHGSIFRAVHQETDIGIDGHIELIDAENATGKLVAVQVRSGDSYVAKDGDKFSVSVDQRHLDYWCSYLIPVVLICYSPSRNLAAWTSISEYVRNEEYHDRTPVTRIEVPFNKEFSVASLNQGIAGLATAAADRRILIDCVDKCLSGDPGQKFQGLSILAAHPDSRESRTTAFVARHLLFDDDPAVADEAIHTLAYRVGRARWAFSPNNADEQSLITYASDLCSNITAGECQRLIERIEDEPFGGPDAMGERVFDLLACCEESQGVLEETAANKELPMRRRIRALFMMYGCDDAELLDNRELANDTSFGDVYRAMYAEAPKNDA